MNVGQFIVIACQYYLMAGLFVAVLFLLFGIDRVEEGARGSFAFRPLLVPGLTLLWPLVLWRWWVLHKAESVSHENS